MLTGCIKRENTAGEIEKRKYITKTFLKKEKEENVDNYKHSRIEIKE